ncbi:MAG TPA: SWIM zinc finger family protein [Pyrinomonadaceae bacterium]|nr:SWIM zinc finger family protein [Pyrinomonadaceae bacterium]
MNFTTEQIIALAPDASSAKAGRALADAAEWTMLGRSSDGRAVWGACAGSGREPYRTEIDTDEPAFRCTCPSRKFPCKHALGLLLLLAARDSLFTETTAPAHVAEWLMKRDEQAQEVRRGKRGRARRRRRRRCDAPQAGSEQDQTRRRTPREGRRRTRGT